MGAEFEGTAAMIAASPPTRLSGADVELLVGAAARGDERAWETIVRQFTPLVASHARFHRLNSHDADDVAQRTWMRVYLNIDRLRNTRALAGWISTTARRECLRTATAAIRNVPLDDVALEVRDSFCAHEFAVQRERREAVRGVVELLPDHQRRLMRELLSEPSPSYGEVAQRLGKPVGSIGPTRARCIDRLRKSERLCRVVAES